MVAGKDSNNLSKGSNNAYQRIYTALSGGIPDRVPVLPKIWVDLAASLTGTPLIEVVKNPLTALMTIARAGIEAGVDAIRQFHFPERHVLEDDTGIYEIDKKGNKIGKVDIYGGLATHLFEPDDFILEDPYMMAYHQYWTSNRPFVGGLEDVKRICVPGKYFYEEVGCGARQRKIIEYAGDRISIIGDCGSATLAFYRYLRGMDNAMLDLVDSPSLVHAVMEKGVAIAIEKGKFNIDLGIKILRLNDSMANMSVISPDHWREFVFPHMKEVCSELHKYDPGVRVYCHICGNIVPVIEDIIETGIDCIGPLDPLGGFTCAQIREYVGENIALMGGINTLSFINCTEEELKEEARNCIREAGKKGAYVLGSGCVIPRYAKMGHLKAAVEAAKKYGTYSNGQLLEFSI
ncbi:MAG: hypothetical protein GX754_00770 [Clostridiaceae bacterium]|nr:hypothetical protein [Clostridiaceae bacterium]